MRRHVQVQLYSASASHNNVGNRVTLSLYAKRNASSGLPLDCWATTALVPPSRGYSPLGSAGSLLTGPSFNTSAKTTLLVD